MKLNSTRIIGLDPGLRLTGWGIIESEGNQLRHIGHGVIKSNSKESTGNRLKQLFEGLQEILTTYAPHESAIEETFMNSNPYSSLKLGLARGVALLAPATFNLEVYEYAPNTIKKSVVGAGHATKDQVAMMVQTLLPQARDATLDAADALAVAICHAHHRGIHQLVRSGLLKHR